MSRYSILLLCVIVGLAACDSVDENDFREGSFTATVGEPVNRMLEGVPQVQEIQPDIAPTEDWLFLTLPMRSADGEAVQEIWLVYGGSRIEPGTYDIHVEPSPTPTFYGVYRDSTYLEEGIEIQVIFETGTVTITEGSDGGTEGVFDMQGTDLYRFGAALDPDRVRETLEAPLRATGTFILPR